MGALTDHPYYDRWKTMIARCHQPANAAYDRYGGRGIKVCEEWHDRFAFYRFLEENLGPCPEGHSLDRINNDGDYEPTNVQWADRFEQRRTQRSVTKRGTSRKVRWMRTGTHTWRIGVI